MYRSDRFYAGKGVPPGKTESLLRKPFNAGKMAVLFFPRLILPSYCPQREPALSFPPPNSYLPTHFVPSRLSI